MPNPIDLAKPEFENVLSHLDQELRAIRGGRAHAAMVEHIKVEAYGSTMDMKNVASISVPDAKTIQIEPWDTTVVKDIEKSLIAANLGMSPTVAGTVIRLNLPPMTEENRRDMAKIVHQKGEQSRISLRSVRERTRESILKQEKDKIISEDERFRLCDFLDKVIGDYNRKIDAAILTKERELLTV